MTFSKLSSHSAYAVGLFCVVVWGITFVNTKVLLLAGLSPSDVLFYRTLIAWSALIVLLPKPIFSKSWKDEGIMVLLGMLGGSLYLFDGKYGPGLYPSEQRRGVGDDVASLDRIGGDGDPPGFSGTGALLVGKPACVDGRCLRHYERRFYSENQP